jgi:predicted acylesterase/phospholipase RssA
MPPPRPPQAILAISGGGMYGAYSAGFLAGWTQSATRPEFDVVTGVSTGALVAAAAFLGPEYDDLAYQSYTRVRASDIYSARAWVLIPWSESLASSKPLEKLIDGSVGDAFVAAVAREHLKGRRLYVGTTNLETQRLTIWDMGAIAARGGPGAAEKFRQVLLASCSVPGMLPPVWLASEINGRAVTELHSDGGATAPLFVPPGLVASADGRPSGVDVFVIVSGKLFADPTPVRPRVLSVLSATASTVIYSSTRAEVAGLYHLTREAGGKFHLSSLPEDFAVPEPIGLSFDRRVMSELYDTGFRLGAGGPAWQRVPPFESSATEPPRE